MKKFLNRYSKVIVCYSIIIVTLFIVAGLILAACGAFVPDALIYGTFAYFGVEGGILGVIKVTESKQRKAELEDTEG